VYTTGGSTGGLNPITSLVLNVPAGTYAVTATGTVYNDDSTSHEADCRINGGNVFITTVPVAFNSDATIPLLGNYTFSAPGSLTLACIGGPHIAMLDFSMIQAVKIG
jgi:hypothetical protein